MQTTTQKPLHFAADTSITMGQFEIKSPFNQQEQWAYPRSIQVTTNTQMLRESMDRVNQSVVVNTLNKFGPSNTCSIYKRKFSPSIVGQQHSKFFPKDFFNMHPAGTLHQHTNLLSVSDFNHPATVRKFQSLDHDNEQVVPEQAPLLLKAVSEQTTAQAAESSKNNFYNHHRKISSSQIPLRGTIGNANNNQTSQPLKDITNVIGVRRLVKATTNNNNATGEKKIHVKDKLQKQQQLVDISVDSINIRNTGQKQASQGFIRMQNKRLNLKSAVQRAATDKQLLFANPQIKLAQDSIVKLSNVCSTQDSTMKSSDIKNQAGADSKIRNSSFFHPQPSLNESILKIKPQLVRPRSKYLQKNSRSFIEKIEEGSDKPNQKNKDEILKKINMQRSKRLTSSSKVFSCLETEPNKSDTTSNFDGQVKINRNSDLNTNNFINKCDSNSYFFDNVSSQADRSHIFQMEDDFLKSSILEVESFKNEEGPTPTSSQRNLNDISVISCTAMSQISPVYPISRVLKEDDLFNKQNGAVPQLSKQSVSSYFPSASNLPQNMMFPLPILPDALPANSLYIRKFPTSSQTHNQSIPTMKRTRNNPPVIAQHNILATLQSTNEGVKSTSESMRATRPKPMSANMKDRLKLPIGSNTMQTQSSQQQFTFRKLEDDRQSARQASLQSIQSQKEPLLPKRPPFIKRNLNSSKTRVKQQQQQMITSMSNNDNSLLSMDMLLSEEDDKQQDEAMLNIINDDSSTPSNSVKAVQPKPLIQTFSIEDLEASPIRVAGVTASQQIEFEDDYKHLFSNKPIYLARPILNSNLQSPQDGQIPRNLQSSHGLLQTAEFKHQGSSSAYHSKQNSAGIKNPNDYKSVSMFIVDSNERKQQTESSGDKSHQQSEEARDTGTFARYIENNNFFK